MRPDEYLLVLTRLIKNFNEELESLATQLNAYIKLTKVYLSGDQKERLREELTVLTTQTDLQLANPWMDLLYLLKVVDCFLNGTQYKTLPKKWQQLMSDIADNDEWLRVIKGFAAGFDVQKIQLYFYQQQEIEQWLNGYDDMNLEFDKKMMDIDTINVLLNEVQQRTFIRHYRICVSKLICAGSRAKRIIDEIQALALLVNNETEIDCDNVFIVKLNQKYDLAAELGEAIRMLKHGREWLRRKIDTNPDIYAKNSASIRLLDAQEDLRDMLSQLLRIESKEPSSLSLNVVYNVFKRLNMASQNKTVKMPQVLTENNIEKVLKCFLRRVDTMNFSKLKKQLAAYVEIINQSLDDFQRSGMRQELYEYIVPFAPRLANPWMQEVEIIELVNGSIVANDSDPQSDIMQMYELIKESYGWEELVGRVEKSAGFILYKNDILDNAQKIRHWLVQNHNASSMPGSPSSPGSFFGRRRTVIPEIDGGFIGSRSRSDSINSSDSEAGSLTLATSALVINHDRRSSLSASSDGDASFDDLPLPARTKKRSSLAEQQFGRRRSSLLDKLFPLSKNSKNGVNGLVSSANMLNTELASQINEVKGKTILKLLVINDEEMMDEYEKICPVLDRLKTLAKNMSTSKYDFADLRALVERIGNASIDELYELKDDYSNCLEFGTFTFIETYNLFQDIAEKISQLTAAYVYLRQEQHRISKPVSDADDSFHDRRTFCVERMHNKLEQVRELKMAAAMHITDGELIETNIEKIIRYISTHNLLNIEKLIATKIAKLYQEAKSTDFAESPSGLFMRASW